MRWGRLFIPALIVAAGVLTGGCDREAIRSQEWWDTHRDQAEQKLGECSSMAVAERVAKTNCARALVAVTKAVNAGTDVLPPAESWVKRDESNE